jgi:hypothetical protein
MYLVGTENKDKEEADRVFKNNMTRIILRDTKFAPLRYLRLRRVFVYYKAVDTLGGVWFWREKNPPETLGLVTA